MKVTVDQAKTILANHADGQYRAPGPNFFDQQKRSDFEKKLEQLVKRDKYDKIKDEKNRRRRERRRANRKEDNKKRRELYNPEIAAVRNKAYYKNNKIEILSKLRERNAAKSATRTGVESAGVAHLTDVTDDVCLDASPAPAHAGTINEAIQTVMLIARKAFT
jgi:hypothetical protein